MKKRPDGMGRGRNSEHLFRRKYPMQSDTSRGMFPLEACRLRIVRSCDQAMPQSRRYQAVMSG
jgi:hypothetical protein